MLMESVPKKTTLFENIGPPLLQNVDKVNLKYLKYYSQLKKLVIFGIYNKLASCKVNTSIKHIH